MDLKTVNSFPSLNSAFTEDCLAHYGDMGWYISFWTLIITWFIYTVYGLWLYSVHRGYKSSWYIVPFFMVMGVVVGFAVGTPFGFMIGGWYESGGYHMSPLSALLWGIAISMLSFLQAISTHSEII
jgi:hypothetical protein